MKDPRKMSFLPLATADICDTLGEDVRIIQVPWRSFGRRVAFQGPAVTFRAEDDTMLIRQILETAGNGRVLIVDNAASDRHAVFGDRFGALVRDNNWAGVVIHGFLRDTVSLARMDIGVLALGVCPLRPLKNGAGEPDVELIFGGTTVRPNDWITVDPDGVVVTTAE